MRTRFLLAAIAALALPAGAVAHGPTPSALPFGEDACGGAPLTPTSVITGAFGSEMQGTYVMVPFDVPAGTTQVRVKYCYDAPDRGPAALTSHTIDLGLWDARDDAPWDEDDFRGWGGSSHPDVQITPQGFAAGYSPSNKANVPGFTTRGFVPGAVEPGRWAVELGVGGVVSALEGDSDATVRWRVEIELSSDPAFAAVPYVPVAYPSAPAKTVPGWYRGDLHVHSEHSSLGDAPMTEVYDYAFGPRPGKAGLDFFTLSEYVTTSGWGETARAPIPDGKLVMRSAEVITYKGHANNHGSVTYVDHRTGAVHERLENGTYALIRAARPGADVLRAIRAAGGIAQINHPTIFPSAVPGFSTQCRGCPWDHTMGPEDWKAVHALEVHTGPGGIQGPDLGPNPFTPLAIDMYERAMDTGARIAAVASSDSHNAGRRNNQVTQSPIGQGTTVVYADELSEDGVARALRRRHTFVKVFAADRPDLRLEAVAPGQDSQPPAIMGDVVRAGSAKFTARVTGGDPSYQVLVVKDGVPVLATPVASADFSLPFDSLGEGRYRLQLQRGTTIEGLTSPIWLDADAPPEDFGDGIRGGGANAMRLVVRRTLRVKSMRAACAARGYELRECQVRVRARSRGRVVTIASGAAKLRGERASVRIRLTRAGKLLMRRNRSVRATLELRAVGARGTLGPERRRVTLRR